MPTLSRPAALVLLLVLAAGCAAPAASNPVGSPSPAASATAPPADPPAPTASAIATGSAAPEPSALPSAARIAISWRALKPASPPAAREDHTWTVDPATRIAYLFGGRDGGTVHGDLWAYDLASDAWPEVTPATAGPEARFGHEAVWVDGVGLVVWAGQADPSTFFDDLWAYDPATNRWRELPNDGARPVARYGSCAALGPDGRLWISHGFTEDGTRFADTRAYDFEAGSWSDETPAGSVPVNRCLHGCWWTDDGELALYAGQTTGVQALGDLWRLAGPGTETAAWARVDGALPDDRNLYAFARHGDRILVFGGRGLGSTYHRDLHAIDATTLAVEEVTANGSWPRARSGATLIDDPAGGRMLLFGGRNRDGALADTWELRLP